MSEEEIKKQYANGIVDIDKLVGSLIDKFKTDKTSVDIQQLQLVAEYLIYKADKLQKENKEYIDIFNSTEKIMNGQERTKDKLLKENVELQKENKELKENNKELVEINNKYNDMKYITRIAMLYVSKDKIRDKIKELEEELIQNYGTLGESLTTTEIKTLKELLGSENNERRMERY